MARLTLEPGAIKTRMSLEGEDGTLFEAELYDELLDLDQLEVIAPLPNDVVTGLLDALAAVGDCLENVVAVR